ncbi:DUF6232 family protein [Paraburkholderia sp. J76]|uniref:DUF6232 family protein n=1 Tax=Paraburkholderia sp. J76 TaxID=2805439 RepID=UPI002ABD3124|nr:DUF6232 family protein [Paraburkholderia sp. J76]
MELPFNEAAVSVTRNALSAAGQVFPMRDIDDVRIVIGRRSRVVPIAISLVGAAGAVVGGVLGSAAGLACGVMVIVVGWLAWLWQEALHRLYVVTGGESREAVTSLDAAFLERVEQAVRTAKAAQMSQASQQATQATQPASGATKPPTP